MEDSFLSSSSPLDSALLFVFAAFTLNVIVVILAFCYFDPSSIAPLSSRLTIPSKLSTSYACEAQVFFV